MPGALEPRARLSSDGAQAVEIENMDQFAVGVKQALRLKTRQRPANSFQRDPKKTSHVVAGKAQVEFVPGISAARKPRRNIQKQRGDALIGAQRAENCGLCRFAHDLAA